MTESFSTQADLALSDLVPIYRRRRGWLWGTTIAFIALMAIYCLVCTPKYDALGVIEVKRASTDALNLDSMNGTASTAADALSAGMDLQTEAEILQSSTLALKTIQALNLEHTKDFQSHWSPIGWAMGLISPKGKSDPPGVSLENAPVRRAKVLKIFKNNLEVKVDSGSRLIDVTYRSSDPATSAAVVNYLIKGLTDYTFETRLNATSQASQWLSGQLTDLRNQSEALQAKVLSLQQNLGVYSLGGTDASGNPQVYSSVLDHLQQATTALAEAKTNRILKQAIYENIKGGNADLISGLAGNTAGQSASSNNSLALLQALRGQEATLQQQIDSSKAKYGDAYPTLKEQQAGLQAVRNEIQHELGRIAGRARSDYEVAKNTEETTLANYDEARKQAEMLNNKGVELTINRQEADNIRGLYEDLLKRLKEAGVLEGWRSSNIAVVDPGRVPSTPSKPRVPLYLALAALAGLFCGVGAGFLVDNMDDKIQTVHEIERRFPVLGVLPYVRDKRDLARFDASTPARSALIEALRGVRVSLMLGRNSTSPRTILITSGMAGEGKTTVSKNLATVFAKQRCRVLLVDVDLRKSSATKKVQTRGKEGLSELLSDEAGDSVGEQFMTSVPAIPNLFIMPAGNAPSDPVDLLDAHRMHQLISVWREMFDVVMLDSPPILEVADSLPLAGMVDTTILVARPGLTPRTSLRKAYQVLDEHVDPSRVRVVINGVKEASRGLYGSVVRSSAISRRGSRHEAI